MKKRVLCIILALLMVFPLVFASFADTETGSRDRGSVSLSKTSDGDTLVKETPAAKETPGASDPAEQPEEIEPAEQPDEIEEPEVVEPIEEPEEIAESEIVPEVVEEPEESDEPEEADEPNEIGSSGADIWDQIGWVEESAFSGREDAPSAGDFAALTDQVKQTVQNWDGYVAGSLTQNGSALYWEGVDGIPYAYSPELREQMYLSWEKDERRPVKTPGAQCFCDGEDIGKTNVYVNGVLLGCNALGDNIPFTENDVAVFLPLYGLDPAFDWSFKAGGYRDTANWIRDSIVRKTEGCESHVYIFTQEFVTVTRIARALATCRVVLINTHGCTEHSGYYVYGVEGDQYEATIDPTDNADMSYITLASYDQLSWYDDDLHRCTYDSHLLYRDVASAGIRKGWDENGNIYEKNTWIVSGNVIAKEIERLGKNLDIDDLDSFLWLGACFSMGTPGFCEALCKPEKGTGVKVVAGFSETVFADYEKIVRNSVWARLIEGMGDTNITVEDAAEDMWVRIMDRQPCNRTTNPKYSCKYDCYPVFVSHTGKANDWNTYGEPNYDAYPGQNQLHLGWYGAVGTKLTHSKWTLVEPDPDPDPDPSSNPYGPKDPYLQPNGVTYDVESLDPNHLHFPVCAPYMRTYYRGADGHDGVNYHAVAPDWESSEFGYNRDYVFLRYEWEVGSDGNPTDAYAVFSTNYEVDDLYDKIDNGDGTFRYVVKEHTKKDYGVDDYSGPDEAHHFCLKVKMKLSFDAAEGKWKAEIPGESPYSPTYSNGGWDEYVQYYDYTQDEYDKGWVFDHWEFTWSSDKYDIMPQTAYAVYYNAWRTNDEINGIKRVPATITREDHVYEQSSGHTYNLSFAEIGDNDIDGVTRKTGAAYAIRRGWDANGNEMWYTRSSLVCGTYKCVWIYDGVDTTVGEEGWDFSQYDSATGEGYATVTVKYHCAHCGTEENCTVKAYVTEKTGNDYTFTAFIGQVCGGVSWLHYSTEYNAGIWDAGWRDPSSTGGLDYITRYESTTKTIETQLEWGEPTYEWVQNGNAWKCRATRVRLGDSSHVETETATATGKLTASATCTTKGKTTYTATFTNPAFTTQTKTVEDIPALGHDWIFDGFFTGYEEGYLADSHEWIIGFYSEDERIPWEGGIDAAPYYHCSSCDGEPGQDWFEEYVLRAMDHDPLVRVFSVNDGHPSDAPLRVASIAADDSLDGQAHQVQGVCGQSSEWRFIGFEWDPDDPETAYAIYQTPNTETSGSDNGSEGYKTPFIEVAEYYQKEYETPIEIADGGYWNYFYEIKVPVNPSKDESVTETEMYKAEISAEQSPDNMPHEDTNVHEHAWDVEEGHIHWKWDPNSGNPTATAMFDCLNCDTTKVIGPITATKGTGENCHFYTATVTLNGVEYTNEHEYMFEDDHEWFITSDNSYWDCHSNNGNPTTTAIFHCKGCDAIETVGPVSMTRKAETGEYCHHYEATVTGPDNNSYTHRHSYAFDKDHAWNIQWTWSETEAKATAVFDCMGKYCKEHHEYDMNDIVITREEDENCHRYKATVILYGVEYTNEHTYMFEEDHEWRFLSFSYNWETREVKAEYICKGLGCYSIAEADAELKRGSGADCHKYWGYISAEASLDQAEHDGHNQPKTKVFEEDHEWVYMGFSWDGVVKVSYHCAGCDEMKSIHAELRHGNGEECHKYWGYISATASLNHEAYDSQNTPWIRVFEDDHEWVYDGITWNTDGAFPTAKAAFHCKGKDNCGHDNDEVEATVVKINVRMYKATFTGLDGIQYEKYYTVTNNDLTIVPRREKVTKPGLPPIKPIIPIPGPPVKPAVR